MKSAREEAARWFARIGNTAPDHPDRGRFEAWLGAHPAHATEYAAFAALWDDFDSTPRLDALARAVEKRADSLRQAEDIRRESRRNLLKRGALGLFLCGTGTLAWRAWQAQPVLQLTLSTRIAQTAKQTLPDGSIISLNADSALAVTYYRDRREARLDRGEAVFHVARDEARPFVVHSGIARITVLGTHFAVARLADSVRVSVASGRVSVAATEAARGNAIVLGAGEVAEVTAHAAPQRTGRNSADAFAWQQGHLVFDGATLAEIAESLSRYRVSPVRAEAAGPRITAVVQIADIERFLLALPAIAPVRVESSNSETRILPR